MKLEQGKFCPLIGKDCIQMQCAWFTHVRVSNPANADAAVINPKGLVKTLPKIFFSKTGA